MRYELTVGEASRYLNVDPKTLHRWCLQLGVHPASSSSGRVKLYSKKQLDRITNYLNQTPKESIKTGAGAGEVRGQKDSRDIQLQSFHARLESLEHEVRATREHFAQMLTVFET